MSNLLGSIAVLNAGRMDQHKHVDDYMAFATQGALSPVIAADPPLFGRLYRLAVDNSRARLPIVGLLLARSFPSPFRLEIGSD